MEIFWVIVALVGAALIVAAIIIARSNRQLPPARKPLRPPRPLRKLKSHRNLRPRPSPRARLTRRPKSSRSSVFLPSMCLRPLNRGSHGCVVG